MTAQAMEIQQQQRQLDAAPKALASNAIDGVMGAMLKSDPELLKEHMKGLVGIFTTMRAFLETHPIIDDFDAAFNINGYGFSAQAQNNEATREQLRAAVFQNLIDRSPDIEQHAVSGLFVAAANANVNLVELYSVRAVELVVILPSDDVNASILHYEGLDWTQPEVVNVTQH